MREAATACDEIDVFISYAHLDNQTPSGSGEGWVSEFQSALTLRLGEVLGKPPRIWRDPKLQGNDVFADVLDASYRHAAVLVSVVTPRYVQSDWCQRELAGFWQAAERTGGPVVGHKSRVFKVVKTPVDPTRMPEPVQPLLGYEFYAAQPGSGRPLEFNKLYGPEAERGFWLRMNDLAYDMADTLALLENVTGRPAEAAVAVYLATVTAELQPQRDTLRRELSRQGWRVLPEMELPLVGPDCERVVREQLSACAVAVHLVGATYGLVPEASHESLPAMQARLAAEQAAAAPLARLVWIAPGSAAADARQQAFVAGLRDQPQPGAGSDLLETPLDELARLALSRLTAAKTAAEVAAQAAAKAAVAGDALTAMAPVPRVYLVCSTGDIDAVLPLRDDLFQQGYEVVLPQFEGDEGELRKAHELELRDCDGLLVYYGCGSELWLKEQLAALRRLPTLGRTTALRASALCIAPPGTQAKKLLLTRETRMLRMPDGYEPAVLQPFLDALGAAA